jgi:hypothetical protein
MAGQDFRSASGAVKPLSRNKTGFIFLLKKA